MTDPDLLRQGGERLKRVRLRLGLSVREVERRSLQLVERHQNPDFHLSRTWIAAVEKGLFAPGTFKVHTLSELYGLTLAEIHRYFGMKPGDIDKEKGLFPPKTHLLVNGLEEARSRNEEATDDQHERGPLESTNLLSRLVDVWGEIPVPLLRQLDIRHSLYGYIGLKDRTMWPLLRPGTFVRIDVKQNHIKNNIVRVGAGPFARPMYFLDIRTGYACGWCQLENSILTLIPHPDSGVKARSFRYPDQVEIVGRVSQIVMSVEEEKLAEMDAEMRKKGPQSSNNPGA